MDITITRLLDNGWERIFTVRKVINKHITLRYYGGKIYMRADDGKHFQLPNVRTMEALSQLEWLLADTYAASIETLPEPLRTLAPDIDRALEELLP